MKKFIYYCGLAVCIGVFCVSGAVLVKQMTEKNKNSSQQESLAAVVAAAEAAEAVKEPENEREAYVMQRLASAKAVKLLQEENSDTAGWVSIDDTNIDYPVMYTPEDGSFYLKRDFNKKSSSYGMPFIDGECDLTNKYQNILIYGHHMKNGTMFANLMNYTDKAYQEAHPMIHFDTEEEFGDYQVVAVFKKSAINVENKFLEIIRADTPERHKEFMEFVKANQMYDTGVEAEFGERLLTLMTCEYSQTEGRLFVVAKKVDSGSLKEE